MPDGVLFVGVVTAAWGVALLAAITGRNRHRQHAAIVGHGAWPAAGTLLVFLLAWRGMTAAMMLPSRLPLGRLFVRASGAQPHPHLARLAFITAYVAVWTGFALLALAGDAVLHQRANQWGCPAPGRRVSVQSAQGALLAAVSPSVRLPAAPCRRGLGAARALGLRHGVCFLGCCWALMPTLCAVGVGHLAWMTGLTGVMVIEKTWRRSRQLVPVVGVVRLAWGALVLLHPGWLPAPLRLSAAND